MGSFSLGASRSKSSSKPLTPQEVAAYYSELNKISGGRMNSFARDGTAETDYDMVSGDDLRSVGGAGATRLHGAELARSRALEELRADPSMSLLQRQRATQLTEQDFGGHIDAINKETEAALAQMMANERAKDYSARSANARLSREDMESLADIFFGGSGQRSRGSSWGVNTGGSFAQPT